MYPAYNIAANSRVVQIAARAAATIGRTATCVTSGGGSDANHFNRIGIPTVNLAIGYEHIHTTSEQIPIAELIKTAELVRAIIHHTYAEGAQ
jgi:tripeptide aminopeptidase